MVPVGWQKLALVNKLTAFCELTRMDVYNVQLPDVLPVDTIWCSEAYWCSGTITNIILDTKAHETEGTIHAL